MPLPEPLVTVVGASVHVRPALGEMERARPTLSENPLTGITDIVDEPATPGLVFTMDGLEASTKSVAVSCSQGDTTALLLASPLYVAWKL